MELDCVSCYYYSQKGVSEISPHKVVEIDVLYILETYCVLLQEKTETVVVVVLLKEYVKSEMHISRRECRKVF